MSSDFRIITVVATAVCFSTVAAYSESNRSATIVDTAGVTSDIKDVRFYNWQSEQHFGFHGLAFPLTSGLEVAVRIESVTSIVMQGKNHKVRYLWRGLENELLGTAKGARLEGKSGFGDLTLSLEKLKQITFNEPATNAPTVENPLEGSLTLSDGRVVPVKDPKRYASYYSTAGYLIGGRTRHVRLNDFRFLRGESLVQLSFDKIDTIEFVAGSVTVRLKNGNTATGKLSEEELERVDGFTWIGDDGYYFADAKHVKSIQFTQK